MIFAYFAGISLGSYISMYVILNLVGAFYPSVLQPQMRIAPTRFLKRNGWQILLCLIPVTAVTFIELNVGNPRNFASFSEALGFIGIVTCGAILWIWYFDVIGRVLDWMLHPVDIAVSRLGNQGTKAVVRYLEPRKQLTEWLAKHELFTIVAGMTCCLGGFAYGAMFVPHSPIIHTIIACFLSFVIPLSMFYLQMLAANLHKQHTAKIRTEVLPE